MSFINRLIKICRLFITRTAFREIRHLWIQYCSIEACSKQSAAWSFLFSRETNDRYHDYDVGDDGNKFSFPLIFICGNDTVTKVTMNKVSHLFAFSFHYLSFSFNFKLFLPIKTTIWTPSTQYCVHTCQNRLSL